MTVNPSECSLELRLDRGPLPTIAARKDKDCDVGRIDVRHGLRGQHGDAAHGADRRHRQTNGFDVVVTMATQFSDGVGRLPIGKSLDNE